MSVSSEHILLWNKHENTNRTITVMFRIESDRCCWNRILHLTSFRSSQDFFVGELLTCESESTESTQRKDIRRHVWSLTSLQSTCSVCGDRWFGGDTNKIWLDCLYWNLRETKTSLQNRQRSLLNLFFVMLLPQLPFHFLHLINKEYES